MPKPTFLNLPDEKRERITELAIDEFSTHPYRQASLSRIVARAGIAKGSMYQYFENKLDLYQWLVVEELERRRKTWLDTHHHDPGEGLFGELEQRALTSVGFLLDHPRLARLAAAAMEPTADAELRTLHSRLRQNELDALAEAIQLAKGRGEVREDLETRALAHMIEAIVIRGLPDAVLASAGVDMHSFDSAEHSDAHIEEDTWRTLVQQSLAMLQSGIGGVNMVPAATARAS